MTSPVLPDGFAPHFRKSPFSDPWEPLYSRVTSEKVVIGLYLREPHCNSRGMVHGGLIASLADNAMGLSLGQIVKPVRPEVTGMVTVNLSTDYIGAAKVGQWVEFDTISTEAGGSLGFTSCEVRADGTLIAKASATFKILKK